MASNSKNALIPVPKRQPLALKEKNSKVKHFELVSGNIHFETREDVRSLLPDILGKVLARVWIDPVFHRSFSKDPQATLEKGGVFLPDTMSIEFQKADSDRPRIVVYERKENSKFRLRVLYLQLVMMAGR
ncbi:MAG: hypothetical protein P8M50_02725 [Paracoccaceae bacterium]|nr:hypothetical protein [Paracoccaceae bacterium]